jgi:LysM repeat protein
MQRSWPAPDQNEGPLERLKAAARRLLPAPGGSRQQAEPLSTYRGAPGPVVPYHERRQQLARARRRQPRSYTAVFVAVLLVVVVGLVYGLAWAFSGGLSLGVGGRAAATPVTRSVSPGNAGTPTVAALPPAAPGGTAPSPSPAAGVPAAPGVAPAAVTPEPRTYVVRQGDTPASIAQQFGISSEALIRSNNIPDPRALRIGQTLVIPPPSTPTPVAR